MIEKIFLTGGAGFIGKKLVASLSKKYELICFVRKSSDIAFLKNMDVTIKYGDITDKKSVQEGMSGADKVIHLAALIGSSDSELNNKVNVDGTKNILSASKKENIKQLVILSSINAKLNIGAYGESKRKADELIMKSGLNFTILRPCLVLGEKSRHYTSLLKSINKSPIIPLVGSGKVQPICVDDLVLIIEKIIKYGGKKDIYDVGGSTQLSTRKLISKICKKNKINKIRIIVPKWIMIIATHILGKKAPFNKDQIRIMYRNGIADIKPLEKEFDIKLKNIEQILDNIK